MTREVVWSAAARDDYLEIIRYIAERNPSAALRLAERVDRAVSRVADMSTGRKGRVTGTFEKVIPASPYIVAYEIAERPDGVGGSPCCTSSMAPETGLRKLGRTTRTGSLDHL